MRTSMNYCRILHVATLLALTACGKANAPGGKPPPPPEVSVISVAPSKVAITTELPGRTEAVRVAQVRARVAGIVQKRTFREGSDVKAGEVLFRIDPAPFQALLNSARAARAKADANLNQANL